MSYLQCYTKTWRNAHCPYFLCFSDTWRMSYLQIVQNQCILQQSLRRLKLLKNLENVIFARKWQIWHSPGFTRRQLNKCHKSYNNNNTVLAQLKLSYMPMSGYLGVKKVHVAVIWKYLNPEKSNQALQRCLGSFSPHLLVWKGTGGGVNQKAVFPFF